MGEADHDNEPPWTDRLRELLLPVVRHRIERLGRDATGAYNFYDMRVKRGDIFLGYEIALVHKLLTCGLDIRRIDEIGSGFGQLMFLLGWNGFKTVGYESDRPRARTAKVLWDILNLAEPELSRNVRLFDTEFPSRRLPAPEPGTLVVTTNLVATRSEPRQLAVLEAMRRYPFVVSDVQRFFEYRSDTAQEPEALALFSRAGLRDPQLFLDLGPGGRYYLFTNAGTHDAGLLSAVRRYWRSLSK